MFAHRTCVARRLSSLTLPNTVLRRNPTVCRSEKTTVGSA